MSSTPSNSDEKKLKRLSGKTYGETVVHIIKSMIKTMNYQEVIEMRRNSKMTFLNMMYHRYRDLRDTSPTLFEKVIEDHPHFDLKRLITMMGISDRVTDTCDMTYEDASKHIGQRYYDEYIKPNIQSPANPDDNRDKTK